MLSLEIKLLVKCIDTDNKPGNKFSHLKRIWVWYLLFILICSCRRSRNIFKPKNKKKYNNNKKDQKTNKQQTNKQNK